MQFDYWQSQQKDVRKHDNNNYRQGEQEGLQEVANCKLCLTLEIIRFVMGVFRLEI